MVQYRLRAKIIRLALRRKLLSQNALARQLELCSGYMSQLLGGSRFPGRKTRLKMLEAPYLRDLSFNEMFAPVVTRQASVETKTPSTVAELRREIQDVQSRVREDVIAKIDAAVFTLRLHHPTQKKDEP